jgi:uncharacterized membrane protein
MPPWVFDIVHPLNRWIHMVCTTLIVGGTLFFELVLPIAIEDLKREQQLYVFARARLVFRWVVWISVMGLIASGLLSGSRSWHVYTLDEYSARWAIAHILLSCVAMFIALLLTLGRQPPENPVRWMRLNLVILLVAIFLGSATRHFQLGLSGRRSTNHGKVPDGPMPIGQEGASIPTAQSEATQPALSNLDIIRPSTTQPGIVSPAATQSNKGQAGP